MELNNLKELNTIITKIIELFKANDNLCKYIYYNDTSPLSNDNLTKDQKIDLFNKNIFPLPKSYNVETNANNLIDVFIGDVKPSNKNIYFGSVTICIDVICNLNNWKIDTGIRPYYIAHEIDKLLRGYNFDDGYCLTELSGIAFKVYSDNFHGYRMAYTVNNMR